MAGFCSSCGSALVDGAQFCSECGARSGGGSTESSPAAPPAPLAGTSRGGLSPLAAIGIVVAAVAVTLGAVLLLRGGDEQAEPSSTVASSSGTGTTDQIVETVPDGEAGQEAVGFGRVELTPPDPELVVETAEWGTVPGDYIVAVLDEGEDRERAEAIASAIGGTVVGEIEYIGLYQIALGTPGETGLADALEALSTAEGVAYAFPDLAIDLRAEYRGVRTSPLNDSEVTNMGQAGPERIGVQRAWDYIAGSGLDLWESKVGVVDDGFNNRSGEFSGDVAVTRSDGVALDGRKGWHGTEATSIIAADPDNGGLAGIASILRKSLSVSVANGGWDDNFITASEIPQVISKSILEITRQVETEGVKVVNLSWGRNGMGPSELHSGLAATTRRFFEKMAEDHPDVLFVCAAGNDGHDKVPDREDYWPCGHELPNVITVAHTKENGDSYGGTVHGSPDFEVTVGTPATSSSWAAPQVTAAAALMRALDPSLSAGDIKQIIRETARKAVETESGTANVDPGVGSGMLAVDEAVLAVINKVRADNGEDPITGEQLVSFGVVDAVAIGNPDEFTVRATITGCRGECTDVTISVTAEHALGGPNPASLSGPGEVEWELTVDDDYPISILVRRTDNGAGSRITIDPVEIAGVWSGTLRITEIKVPEGQTAPDGSVVEPGWYDAEEVLSCADEMGQAIDEAVEAALEQLRQGVPITMTFSGTWEEPGTVVMSTESGPGDSVPWSVSGGSIVIEAADEDGYGAISLTPSGPSMSGSFGSIDSDGLEMRGVVSLTKVG